MKIQSVNKEKFVTTEWSGGTTTEYFIYPEGSSYKDRRFAARISSAVMEVEYSCFTELAGVTRYLAPLSDEVKLKIDGEEVNLDPYEIIKFSGSDKVESFGTCRDFNLMLKGINGSMDCVHATKSGVNIKTPHNMIVAVYSYKPASLLLSNGRIYELDENALFLLYNENEKKEETFKISSDVNSSVLVCKFEQCVSV